MSVDTFIIFLVDKGKPFAALIALFSLIQSTQESSIWELTLSIHNFNIQVAYYCKIFKFVYRYLLILYCTAIVLYRGS